VQCTQSTPLGPPPLPAALPISTVRSAIDPYLQPDAVVRTVALCRNAGATLNPDLWAWTVDDWVHFPWEPPPQTTIAIEELPIPGDRKSTRLNSSHVKSTYAVFG